MSDRRPTVRVDGGDGWKFYFGDAPYEASRNEYLIVRRPDLAGCIASDLENAFEQLAHPPELLVTDDDEQAYDLDESPTSDVTYEISLGRLYTRVSLRVPAWVWDEDDEDEALEHFLAPLLNRSGLTIAEFRPLSEYGYIDLEHLDRDVDLQRLLEAAENILALLDASRGDAALTMRTAADMIRAGRVGALVGQRETEWFDAKTAHYDLTTMTGKVSLGQAVARFCNAEGGIIVVGLATEIRDGEESVSRVAPVPVDFSMRERYRKTIDERVYPFPDGLRVTAVLTAERDGMIMLVEIPPQPEYQKPYLVSGAIVDGKTRGEFISIVRRRDDGSEPMKAPMIHAWLAAGRALVQRGELPGDRQTGVDGGNPIRNDRNVAPDLT